MLILGNWKNFVVENFTGKGLHLFGYSLGYYLFIKYIGPVQHFF